MKNMLFEHKKNMK